MVELSNINKVKGYIFEYSSVIVSICWALALFWADNWTLLIKIEVLLLLFLIATRHAVHFDIGDALLGVGMFLFYHLDGWTIDFSLPWVIELLVIYQIGKMIVNHKESQVGTNTLMGVVPVAVVFWARGFVNYMMAYINPSIVVDECWPMFGSNLPTARTQHEFWLVLAIAILPFFLFSKIINLKLRVMGFFIGVIGMFFSVHMEGRIAFLIFLINTLIILAMQMYEKRKTIRTKFIVFGGIAIFSIAILSFKLNWLGLYDKYKNSMWAGGGGIIHNTRLFLWKQGIKWILQHPEGTVNVPDNLFKSPYSKYVTSYAHNSWIDIGIRSGVGVFVIIILFTLFIIYKLLKLSLYYKFSEMYALIFAYNGVFLYNFVEPAIYANRVFWFALVFFSGMIVGVNNKIKKEVGK